MVVHGNDGLDEISLSTSTRVVEVKDGELHTFEIAPETSASRPPAPPSF